LLAAKSSAALKYILSALDTVSGCPGRRPDALLTVEDALEVALIGQDERCERIVEQRRYASAASAAGGIAPSLGGAAAVLAALALRLLTGAFV
jgi:hypothetical protein